MWKYDLLKKVTVTVSLGDNFFTPSWLLFLPPSSSSSPSEFSSLGLSELSWFTRSTPSPLVTSLFSWGGFGLKEDTSLNKVKTTIFVKNFVLHLRRLPQSGAISDRALNSEMMSTMDLVAGKGWAAEELMSTMDRVVDVGAVVLLLARCCKIISQLL